MKAALSLTEEWNPTVKRELFHISNNNRVIGNCSGLCGDCSDLWGDCSNLWGDCSGLRGNCSNCELSDADRAGTIEISLLVNA